MFQPCHSCLAPLSRHLLPRDVPKTGHRTEPHTVLLVCSFSWGTDAEDEEEKPVLTKNSLYQVDLGFTGSWNWNCVLMNWCLKKSSNGIKFCPGVWNGN